MSFLILLRGLPGSGKSTLAKQMAEAFTAGSDNPTIHVEADMYFEEDGVYEFDPTKLGDAHHWCQQLTSQHLGMEYNVVVSNTSTQEWEVETYKKIAEAHGAKFISLIVENRHGSDNVHNVPPEKVEQMRKRFSVKL